MAFFSHNQTIEIKKNINLILFENWYGYCFLFLGLTGVHPVNESANLFKWRYVEEDIP